MNKYTITLLLLPLFLAACSTTPTPEVKNEPVESAPKQAAPAPLVLEWVTVKEKPKCEASIVKRKDAVMFTWSGTCKKGKAQGKGRLEMFDEAKKRIYWFEGTMKDGMANGDGKGESIDKEGKVTKGVGKYVNGLRNGPGYTEWSDGTKFETEYKDGISIGKGRLTYASGGWYEGDFVAGKRAGNGTLRYKNGNEFKGTFVDGSPSSGTFRWADGTSQQGRFSGGSWVGTEQYSAFGGTKKVGRPTDTAASLPPDQCSPMSHLKENGDGTFTDTTNGVVWQKCRNGEIWSEGKCTGAGDTTSYNNTIVLAKKSKFLGKTDWRLPSVDEFLSLDRQNLGKICAFKGLDRHFVTVRYPGGDGEGYFWTTDIDKNIEHKRSVFDTAWVGGKSDLVRHWFAGYQWRVIGNDIMLTESSRDSGSVVNGYVLVRGGSSDAFNRDAKSLNQRGKSDKAQETRIEQAQTAARIASYSDSSRSNSSGYSASSNSYCGTSDICFAVVSNERGRAKIKCTKGSSYKIGQTYDICAASNGKWGNCGAFGVSGDYTFTVAGNKACD